MTNNFTLDVDNSKIDKSNNSQNVTINCHKKNER